MPSRLKLFDKQINACNPYKEFWKFLEWLARRRHYPEPIYIWHAGQFSSREFLKKPSPMKFPGRKQEANRFPAADESNEKVKIYRRR